MRVRSVGRSNALLLLLFAEALKIASIHAAAQSQVDEPRHAEPVSGLRGWRARQAPFRRHRHHLHRGPAATCSHIHVVVRCAAAISRLCAISNANAHSGPRQLFGEWPPCVFSCQLSMRPRLIYVSPCFSCLNRETLTDTIHRPGARAFRFAHLSLRAAYRREALGELRMMRRRASACDARLARACRRSLE